MTDERIDNLRRMLEAAGACASPATRLAFARFLRQLVHDYNNPSATFGVELYSMRKIVDRLGPAVARADADAAQAHVDDLLSIQENLEECRRAAGAMLTAVDRISEGWMKERGS